MLRHILLILLCTLLANATLSANELTAEISTITDNTICDCTVTPGSIFNMKYGKDQVFDVFRSPAFPTAGQEQKITVNTYPNRTEVGHPLTDNDWKDGYYMALIDRGAVKDLDLTDETQNYVNTHIRNKSAIQSSGVNIDEIRVVATAMFDKDEKLVEIIGEYGILWGLGKEGFLFVDFGSYPEYGTFYFTEKGWYKGKDPLYYIPEYSIVASIDVLLDYFDPKDTGKSSCTGIISVNVSGGYEPYKYTWNDPLKQTTKDATRLKKGSYTLEVEDSTGHKTTVSASVENTPDDIDEGETTIFQGDSYNFHGDLINTPGIHKKAYSDGDCHGNYIIKLIVKEAFSVKLDAESNTKCDCVATTGYSDCTGIIKSTITGGVAPLTYIWNDPLKQITKDAVKLKNGIYQLRVTDRDGHWVEVSQSVENTPKDIDEGTVTICSNETYNFHGEIINTEGAYKKTYSDGDCFGTYTIYLIVEDCPQPEPPTPPTPVPQPGTFKDLIPNKYFSPNGDGLDDLWTVKNIERVHCTVEIFDRYGERLGIWKNGFNGWDGLYNGHDMPMGDYWFIISSTDSNDRLTGHFTLHR